MTSLKGRIGDLERATVPSGFEVVSLVDPDTVGLSPSEKRQRIADAEQRAGPGGRVWVLIWPEDAEIVPDGPITKLAWDDDDGD